MGKNKNLYTRIRRLILSDIAKTFKKNLFSLMTGVKVLLTLYYKIIENHFVLISKYMHTKIGKKFFVPQVI